MRIYIFTYLSKYINTACFVHIRSLADDGFRSDHLSVWGFIRGEVYSALLQHSLLACIKDFEEYGWKKSVPGDLCDCPWFSSFISGEGLSEWLKRFSNLSSCCLSLQLLRSWVCTTKPGTGATLGDSCPHHPYIWMCTDFLFPSMWSWVSTHILVTPSHTHGDFKTQKSILF